MEKGYVSLVLHSHLPFVRHPDVNDSIEERWLFEVMLECYLPLIEVYDGLLKDGIKFEITMSITPPLMSMLEDDYLQNRFVEYTENLITLCEKEVIRTKNEKDLNKITEFYRERIKKLYDIYKSYDCKLMNAFRKFDRLGVLEIITCSATHAILPLISIHRGAAKAQLYEGIKHYTEIVGHAPNGIWLPECAYSPELDSSLKEYGIKFFIVEDNAIELAKPKPIYGTYTPISLQNGIFAFGRDKESSYQVWSSSYGYPGDANYREFYRDIGFELTDDQLKPLLNEAGIRVSTGLKYYRITGKYEEKDYYDRDKAMERAKVHGIHFADCKKEQIERVSSNMGVPPIITCPYDTELFGHWWFEGPDFINEFIRNSTSDEYNFKLITPLNYMKKYKNIQTARINTSSWGENSDFSVWLNNKTSWILRDIHEMEEKMIRLSRTYKDLDKNSQNEILIIESLNQLARELMLAESSDWPFIIKNGTSVNYAVNRVKEHEKRFRTILDMIINDSIDEEYIRKVNDIDNIFDNIDYKIYYQ